MSYALQITRGNGEQELHRLNAGSTTIGSDPESDICLQGERQILPRHVLVAPSKEHCWVSTAAGAPLWDPVGTAVEASYVAWGTRLTLGKCVLEFRGDGEEENPGKVLKERNVGGREADKGGEADAEKGGRVHPIVFMISIVSIALLALWGIGGEASVRGHGLPEAPDLFATASVVCRSSNPAHRAIVAQQEALARSERSVFDLQDGVVAVGLYEEALACYQKSGEMEAMERVSVAGAALRASLVEEYALLRLRLSRELSADNFQSAALQVRRLLQMLLHQPDGSYVLSLRRLSSSLVRHEEENSY